MAQKASGPPLSLEQVQSLLDLNRESGELRWTARASMGRLTQRIAGCVGGCGYQQIKSSPQEAHAAYIAAKSAIHPFAARAAA